MADMNLAEAISLLRQEVRRGQAILKIDTVLREAADYEQVIREKQAALATVTGQLSTKQQDWERLEQSYAEKEHGLKASLVDLERQVSEVNARLAAARLTSQDEERRLRTEAEQHRLQMEHDFAERAQALAAEITDLEQGKTRLMDQIRLLHAESSKLLPVA